MKLKLFISLLSLFSYFASSDAQRLSITGRIADNENNEPLPYAQIAIYNLLDSVLITGGIANEKGEFEISGLSAGSVRAELSFIGYETEVISPLELSTRKRVYDLGLVRIGLSKTQLEEVEVVGQASATSRRIDKQVYNADQFMNATGGTSIDILKSIPSVAVGPDGEVSLRGTTGFMVYLNGKPTMLEPSVVLSQISANSINTIEVITVPTAAYNAEGKGGIINITTKKSTVQGTNFSGSLMTGGSPFNEDFDPLRYGGNLNFSHTKNKVSIFGGLDYSRRNVRGTREGKARLLQDDNSYYWMNADGDRPEWHINFSGRLGVDIELSENDNLSFGYFSGKKVEGRTAEYLYDNFYGDINENRLGNPRDIIIFNPNTHVREGIFNSLNADYVHRFENKSRLNISLLYEHSRLWSNLDNKDISRMQANYGDTLLAYRQYDNNPLDGYRLAIDYTLPFSNGNELSFGYQPQLLNQGGIFEYDTLDVPGNQWNPYNEFENEVSLKRIIHSGFINYSGLYGKVSYILGLRIEYTNQDFKVENPDYLSLFDRNSNGAHKVKKPDVFPVAHFQYAINERDKILFAYSKRINRPPSKNMAPFLMRRHYEVFEVGDPDLKPEYVNIAEVSYTKGLGKSLLTLTGFYRNTDNAIFRVNTTLNPGDASWYYGNSVLIRSYTNAGNDHATGAELSGDLKLSNSLKVFIGGALYNYRVKGDIFGFNVDRSSTNWNLNTNISLDLLKNLRVFWSQSLTSATVTSQGGNDLFYASDALVSWTPRKSENLNLSFKMVDVFATNNKGLYTRGQDMNGIEIFYQETVYHRYGPIFELNLTYALNRTSKRAKLPDSEFGKKEF